MFAEFFRLFRISLAKIFSLDKSVFYLLFSQNIMSAGDIISRIYEHIRNDQNLRSNSFHYRRNTAVRVGFPSRDVFSWSFCSYRSDCNDQTFLLIFSCLNRKLTLQRSLFIIFFCLIFIFSVEIFICYMIFYVFNSLI